MQNKVTEYYKGLPSWSKGIVAVIGVSAAAFIGYSIYRSIKNRRELIDASRASEQAKQEIDELKRTGVGASYSKSQYETFAQKLVQAMDSCGTSEDSVYSVFQAMKNKADVLSLIAAFGVRYYQPCPTTNPVSYIQFQFNNKAFGGGISAWLEYDLTSNEIKKINDILSKKGINYQF